MKQLLRIDASMRKTGSVSRQLADRLITKLADKNNYEIKLRDLTESIPFVNESWINANFTDPAERSSEQRAILSYSDALVAELKSAEALVIATPIYNFGVPAALKAWIDMIARARETFQYTENGPVGLLEVKKAYVIVTSGGTQLGSEIDFVSSWLHHILGFVGIKDVQIIDGSGLMIDQEAALNRADEKIEAA
ncbi:FMN-dependent NADH-azoreductase [Aliiglaciecola lipolytica]|uniref:FMN dependent NADH:quinone oxidoreductase n=1 Tax=Aliiglaciecola lipolytica E3 TaxID=1127673 RepID=K6YGL3_9ALTE|nr:NAD(P)H-dependent oxidoreductase [Aliiglaciecola lipolytica]GAC15768.1 FMN-dependent NADH-azoreductase 1 [Aliiglaciecola lipolytica E3]